MLESKEHQDTDEQFSTCVKKLRKLKFILNKVDNAFKDSV